MTESRAAPDTGHGDRTLDGRGHVEEPGWGAAAAPLAVSADPVMTYLAVQGGAAEGHPLWEAAIGRIGIGAAMSIRLLLGLVLVAAVMVAVEHDGAPLTRWSLRALTAVFTVVAAWNLWVWTVV